MFLLKIIISQTESVLLTLLIVSLLVVIAILLIKNYQLRGQVKDEKAGSLLYEIVMFDFEFCTYLYRWYKEYKTTGYAMDSFHRAFFFSIERVTMKTDSWRKVVDLRSKISSEFDLNEETRIISQNAFISVGGRIKRLFEQEINRVSELHIPHDQKNNMYQKMVKEGGLFKGIHFPAPSELAKKASLN